jgi:subtilisin-like proprotein convertase family protein
LRLTTSSSSGGRRRAPALVAGLVGACALASLPGVAADAAPVQAVPSVAEQVAAIQADKAARTPAERKVDSNLLYAATEAAGGPAVEGAPALRSSVEVDEGSVVVDLDATATPGLAAAIEAVGGSVVSMVAAQGAVRAEVPVDAVVALAGRPEVREVRPADEAITNRSLGDAVASTVGVAENEADVTQGGAATRTTYGVDGTGVKVCVLSDGIDSLAASQTSGDLPAVDVLPGQAGAGDEGTAMLELIHDIAPGADLGFATAFSGVAQFAQNILDLRADGCDVIVDDVTYFSEPTFQDGPIAQAISTVRAAGAAYFTSAGNSGNLADGTSGTWQGDFQDAGAAAAPLPAGGRLHGWGVGATSNPVTKVGGPLNLQWADPLGGSANDYDLHLLNAAGTAIVSSSTNVQSGTQDPVEGVATPALGTRVVVTKAPAAASRHLVLYSNRGELTYRTGGSARGHNASADAISVGATPAAQAFNASSPTGPFPGLHTTADLSERFSSDGPVRQYFTPAGAPLTPGNLSSTGGVGRTGVDITAADGVATTVAGFTRFYGTSAAAPNAAALAALALEARPSLAPDQLEDALEASAIDIEAVGADPVAGSGIVMGPALLAAAGAAPRAKLAAGARTVVPSTGDGDAWLEPGETATLEQVIANLGGATATDVTVTLTSETPLATVVQGTTTYDPIDPGEHAAPAGPPLEIAVAPSCPCGEVLSFTLTITAGGMRDATASLPIQLEVGERQTPVEVAYAGPPVAIPDASPVGASASVVLPAGAPIAAVTVAIGGSSCSTAAGATTVGIDHSYVGDLTISLTSPQGTTIVLASGSGGGGNNLCQTVFSDAAPFAFGDVSAANAPFTGSFRPDGPLGALAAFAGEQPGGTWTLRAVDAQSADTGTLRAFSVSVVSASCGSDDAAPSAADDAYRAVEGRTLEVAAPGVLANDQDPDGDELSAALLAAPAHGTATVEADGSFRYVPEPGFGGTDSFTYTASDGDDLDVGRVDLQVITAADAYVDAVYRDFLGRSADAAGMAFWSGRLERGVETRTSFVRKMARSNEYATKVVTRTFQDVLGRAPDPSGRTYWARRVVDGMSPSTLVLQLMASNEFLVRSGGTVGGYVDAVYQAILGRAPDLAGRAAKIAAIEAGAARLEVAAQVYRSTESRRRRVRTQYDLLLERQPITPELTLWISALGSLTDTDLAVWIAADEEYVAASADL